MTAVNLCRFDAGGNICSELKDLDNTPYVAVSHVWGDVRDHQIPGIDWAVRASDHKACFIAIQLRQLVEGLHFWMDILAVDQSSGEARAGVVRHIPEIYRKARFTLVVRESGGLDRCCYQAFQWQNVLTPKALQRCWEDLDNHMRQRHPQGFREIWMERNWPLQELMLSNEVHFTVCPNSSISDERLFTMPTGTASVKGWIFIRDLWTMAQSWTGSSGLDENAEKFVTTVFLGGVVARDRLDTSKVSDVLRSLSDSPRQTGRAEDFVLAIFPQFSWYKVPPKPGSMSFGQLLEDMLSQLGQRHDEAEEDKRIRAKITKGMLQGLNADASSSNAPSGDVPLPISVGEFCKLLHVSHGRNPLQGLPIFQAQISSWGIVALDLHGDRADFVRTLTNTLELLDTFALQGFTSQLAVWRDHPARLIAFATAINADLPSSQNEQLTLLNESIPDSAGLDAMLMLSNMCRFVAIQVVPSLMGSLARSISEQNLDASEIGAMNLHPPGKKDEEWRRLLSNFEKYDSATFRESMALLTITVCCDFGLSALPWLRQKLAIFILEEGHSRKRTLCFATQDLDLHRLRQGYTIHVHEKECEPYVIAESRSTAEKRVIGLAPIKGSSIKRLGYKAVDKVLGKVLGWTNMI